MDSGDEAFDDRIGQRDSFAAFLRPWDSWEENREKLPESRSQKPSRDRVKSAAHNPRPGDWKCEPVFLPVSPDHRLVKGSETVSATPVSPSANENQGIRLVVASRRPDSYGFYVTAPVYATL